MRPVHVRGPGLAPNMRQTTSRSSQAAPARARCSSSASAAGTWWARPTGSSGPPRTGCSRRWSRPAPSRRRSSLRARAAGPRGAAAARTWWPHWRPAGCEARRSGRRAGSEARGLDKALFLQSFCCGVALVFNWVVVSLQTGAALARARALNDADIGAMLEVSSGCYGGDGAAASCKRHRPHLVGPRVRNAQAQL